MKGLSKKQQKELFAKAELAKKEGYPLVGVFKDFAGKENRAFGSIRNFYYKSIGDGKAGNITVKTQEYFTESAENELIACFLRERKVCGSIRKAAFIMASGDPVLALRYQNKFFNLLKKKREAVIKEMKKLQLNGEAYYDPYADSKKSVIYKHRKSGEGVSPGECVSGDGN